MLERLLGDRTEPTDRESARPIDAARELVREPEPADGDWAEIFRTRAVPVAHGSELARPGDYLAREIAGAPLLLVCGRDRVVRGFRNLCRHRGAPLAEVGAGAGCKAFVCPHHGWIYQLDGSLAHVPGEAFFPDLEKTELGLAPVPIVTAYGFLWTLPGADARGPDAGGIDASLRASLGPFGEELDGFGLAGYCMHSKRQVVTAGHWQQNLDACLAGADTDGQSPRVWVDWFGDNQRTAAARPDIAALTDTARAEWDIRAFATLQYRLFPGVAALIHRDCASVLTALPTSAEQTVCTHYLLVPEAVAEGAESERADRYRRAFESIAPKVFARETLTRG